MNINPTELKEKFVNWLKDEIYVKNIGEYTEITSPFLDRYNDYLQIYVKLQNNNELILSDDAYTINNLKMAGIDIDSAKRRKILDNFLNKYRVELINDELTIKSGVEDFPQKIMFLMQAMLNIDDMFMLSQSKIVSLFLDDIKNFFDGNEVFYSENVSFMGKSGFVYPYDYLIQRTRNKPERLCKAINNPNKQNFQSTMFMWNDTKEARSTDSQLIVLLNDENKIDANIIEGFRKYNVTTIPWSERKHYLKELTA